MSEKHTSSTTPRVRVLHVLGELRFSGAEVMLRIAGDRWGSLGVESHIIATGNQIGGYADELAEAGYHIQHFRFDGSPIFLWRMRRLIRANKFDVVHIHTERASMWLCLLARVSGARAVRTVHNSFGFTGALRVRRTVQRWIARRTGTVFISVGASVQANEKSRFRNATQVIPNWLDVERYRPPTLEQRRRCRQGLGFNEHDVVVATVGNCSSVKNHSALLQAIAGHDAPLQLVHVGEEERDQPERQLAEDLGVASKCVFLGRRDPRDALFAADLFAMPSLFEGLGIATAEALATGLPALLTDVPGSRDFRGLDLAITWSRTDADDLLRGLGRALEAHVGNVDVAMRESQHEVIAKSFSLDRGVRAYAAAYGATPGIP